jgi:hypothetical protein
MPDGPGQSGGQPRGSQDDDLPPYLKKLQANKARWAELGITDEDFEDGRKGYLREKDYTQKSQRVAKLERFLQDHPDADAEEAWAELNQWRTWRNNEWPKFQNEYDSLKKQAATAAERGGGEDRTPRTAGKWSASGEDVYQTEKLWAAFDEVQGRSVSEVKQWWEKDERPKFEQYGNRLGQQVLDASFRLTKFARNPEFAELDLDEVVKESAATGEGDLTKVGRKLLDRRKETTKTGYDAGYQKAKEEAQEEKKAGGGSDNGPSGPIGGASPAWKPPPSEARPKTRDERFANVLGAVEKKHGTRLPI